MYYKYEIQRHNNSIFDALEHIISFSYTEITTEPSIIHSHPYTEVILPINDAGELLCGQTRLPLVASKLYIIPQNIAHTEYNTGTEHHLKYFVIKLKETVHSSRQNMDDFEQIILDDIQITSRLLYYLRTALDCLKNDSSPSTRENDGLIVSNILCFYMEFIQYLKHHGFYLSFEPHIIGSSEIEEIKSYISKNYNLDIKIEDLAKKYNMSHNTLLLKFKKQTGMTPKEFLLDQRIKSSKYLLSTSDFMINQIASMCGFTSTAYFIFIFKKSSGITPKQYRLMFQHSSDHLQKTNRW